jgi:hypothetical protein
LARLVLGAKKMKIELSDTELAVLCDYGTRTNGTGGFQGLAKALYARMNKDTRELDIDDTLLGRSVRYTISYGRGGFQDSFLRPLLRRSMRL